MTIGLLLRLVAVMGLWALCFPLITIGLGLAPHLAFAAMRAALAGLSLIAVAIVLRRPLPRGRRTWVAIGIVGLGATSLGFLGMFHAAEYVSPGLATVIANAQPLLAALLAPAVLGEKLGNAGKAGLVVGFAGIVAIAWPGMASGAIRGNGLGIVYISLAAVGVTIGYLAMKRLTGGVDAAWAMGLQLLVGAVPLALASAAGETAAGFVLTPTFLLILIALSVFGTALAFWLWFGALQRTDLNRANAFTFLVPLFGLAIGAAFFGERLTVIQAGGVALVGAGIALVQRDPRGRRP